VTALRLAFTLFTAFPIPGARRESGGAVDRRAAARAVLWLPAVGAVLGGLAGIVLILTLMGTATGPPGYQPSAEALPGPAPPGQAGPGGAAGPGSGGALLAATLAVGMLAVTTRGLHLDGLADTADGLGSAAPAPRALTIMRRADIGPFGVLTLVFVLLGQIAALASIAHRPVDGVAALLLAAVGGRLAVVRAAGRDIPCARPDGFGALVAGTVSRRARVLVLLIAVSMATAIAAVAAGPPAAARCAGSLAAGLLAAAMLRRRAVRRLGGMTGDVFGALIEIAAATTLVAFAVTARVVA
jgi:adenosylcobinamide-GDP ribazoletransferase